MEGRGDGVGRVAGGEGIDCHWAKGGTVQLARSATQMERARDEVAEARSFGFGEEDLRLLSAGEARGLAGASGALGGPLPPHCAAIHPSRPAPGPGRPAPPRDAAPVLRTPAVALAPR